MWILRKDFLYETILTKVRRGYWAGTGSFLDPNLPLVHLLCVWLLMQKVPWDFGRLRLNCAPINQKLQHSPPFGQRTGLSSLPRGGQFEPCLAGVRNWNWLEVSSLSSQEPSGAQVFILNIEVFQFEVRSSLSEGHGVEENLKNVHVLKLGRWILKVTVANFVFSKRLIIKFGTWVGHNFGPNGREFEPNNFQKFKCPGVALRGGGLAGSPGSIKFQTDFHHFD